MNIPGNVVLVLAGGNALGAYQGGAFEALQERGIEPRWVAGASIGAINGALIAGNAPGDRLDRLRGFWRQAEQLGSSDPSSKPPRRSSRLRKSAAANQTLLTGRPGLFVPRLFGLWAFGPFSEEVSLFDTTPLPATLGRHIDFERLNGGAVRFTATAVDAETGDEVTFDTARQSVKAEHLRASTAFPVLYPPVEVDGRMLVDPAVSANLPLRAVFAEMPEEDTFCLAVDLVAPSGARPRNLGDALKRAHDLLFANHARHAIETVETRYRLSAAERALEANSGAGAALRPLGSVTLMQLAYAESGQESGAKMLDYSAASIQERWAAGYRDMHEALEKLGTLPTPERASFTAFRLEGGRVAPYG